MVQGDVPDWKGENAERWRAFEKKPELSDETKMLRKKIDELACVRGPGLAPSMARGLGEYLVVLEREIAELERQE